MAKQLVSDVLEAAALVMLLIGIAMWLVATDVTA